MRSLLLLSSLLFLSACSDTDNQTTSKPKKENTITQKTTSERTNKVSRPVVQVKKSTPSGHSIYAHKCASCHGLKAQKIALNKSQAIAGWDVKKTTEVLIGYQNGTYGSSMKAIMEGQVSTLDDKEIDLLAIYISTL